MISLIPGIGLLKTAGYVALAASMAFGAGYLKGRADGRSLAETEALKKTIEDIRERNADDAETQRLSDYDLCIRDLGRVPECDTLQ